MGNRDVEKFEKKLKKAIRKILKANEFDKKSFENMSNSLEEILYSYISNKGNINPVFLNKNLKKLLIPKNFNIFLSSSINKYFQYLNGQANFNDRLDQYYKDQLRSIENLPLNQKFYRYNLIANQIMEDPETLSKICKIFVKSSMQEINSISMQQVARNTSPNQSFAAEKTLNRAVQIYREIRPYYGYDYSQQWFSYDTIQKTSIGSFNPLENDIIQQGVENKAGNGLYTLNDSQIKMSGILNIGMRNGRFKPKQEDSILLLSHPQNPNFKIALVADGVGGGGDGDKASYLAVYRTMEWFKSLPVDFYTDNYINSGRGTIGLYESLIDLVGNISDEITEKLGPNPR